MVTAETLVRNILTDLRLTLPDDLDWSVRSDHEMVYVLYRRVSVPGLQSESGSRWDSSRCDLACKVISDLQDFIADAYSVWWPQLGQHRLKCKIDGQEDRPHLIFTL